MRLVLLAKTPELSLVGALRAAGHDVWYLKPNPDAYRQARDAFPAAVLIDLAKEAEGGFAAAAELAANVRTKSVPVLLFNAQDVASARAKAPYVRTLLLAPSRHSDLVWALTAFDVQED